MLQSTGLQRVVHDWVTELDWYHVRRYRGIKINYREYIFMYAAAAKLLQSCPTLCDPIDSSPPGSSVPGILQARILEWVSISFSNACMHAKSLQSCPTLCNPMDSSPPGSSVQGILEARILEWVAISFSKLIIGALIYFWVFYPAALSYISIFVPVL